MEGLRDTLLVLLKLFGLKHWDVCVNHTFDKSGYSITFHRTIDLPQDLLHEEESITKIMKHIQPLLSELQKLDKDI